jgi:signal transduction histidine kinase
MQRLRLAVLTQGGFILLLYKRISQPSCEEFNKTLKIYKTIQRSFCWRVPAEMPAIFTDPLKVKVVLKNLFNNAIKFTETGSITVSVASQQNGIEISVSDTGIGIAPESIDIIFEPFRQTEDPMTRQYGGIGLGLYIVRRMLELLEGSISVESIPGQGLTFRIWLPLVIERDWLRQP